MSAGRRPRTAAEIGDVHIDQAARARSPQAPVLARDIILALPRPAVRDAPGAEPVDVSAVNGREPLAWEEAEITAARLRERRAAAVLLAGTGGPP